MKIERAYYPIADAAEAIGCTEDDLIHLGANGRIEIFALFAEPVNCKRDHVEDFEDGGPESCYGVGPFLLDARDLKALEAGNDGRWCKTIWTQESCGRYAFRLLTFVVAGPYLPPVAVCPEPSKLVIMAQDIARLRGADGERAEHAEGAALSPTQEAGGVTITLPHMTKQLDELFDVMRQNWTDPDPRRLPKQINIARELDERLGFSPQKDGSPSRNAKAYAALIKPDTVCDTE